MNEYLMKNWLKSPPPQQHPFNSSSERTLNLDSSFRNPGPGAYNPPLNDVQKTSKYHVSREKQYPIEREFLWMFGSERGEVLNSKGAYDVKESQRKMLQCSWSKASRFKTSPQSAAQWSPGPGYYQSSLKTQTSPGAQFVFKSKLKKSLEFTKQKLHKEAPAKQSLRDPQIEDKPSQSEKKQTKRSQEKSSIFASKVPRFLTDSGVNYVGPGAYDVMASSRSRVKSDLPKVVRFKPSRAPMFREKSPSHIGPGSYNMNKYTLSRELQFKGCAVSRETRFNFSGKKNESSILPGPGSYMQNKYVYLNQKQILSRKINKKLRTTVHILESTKGEPESKAAPGFYNLNAFDIEFRMRKKIEHAKKLKLMDISVPAFNSKVPRLH